MLKLLIITDDFTGALDTGIQFTKQGVKIQIAVEQNPENISVSKNTQVLVIDLETRPLAARQAYNIVKNVMIWAKNKRIDYIYKKTDSALRGNVGAELKAVTDVYEQCIYFIPAFPKIGRITKNGKHYIDNVPLSETAFAKDPFEPVIHSHIKDIITKEYQNIKVCCVQKQMNTSEYLHKINQGVVVFDAETEQDMKNRLYELNQSNQLKLLAGCAGLAEFLPDILELKGTIEINYEKKKGIYVACGSLNPITKNQMEYACQNGFKRVNLSANQKLSLEYYDTEEGKQFLNNLENICKNHKCVIVDTFDIKQHETEKLAQQKGMSKEDVRFAIAKCHGKIVKHMLQQGMDYTIFMTGGDTLMGLMKNLENTELTPVCEISQGVVLSILKWNEKKLQVISKSGGFGNQDVFLKTAEKLIQS
ncbi:four-carbon acid sugar kinase family protein [Clostridium sp. MD294]|uniref:four-carbon acid sugar kinase family protein n=1 Tax=Clostridium sp. MD294 TaxID=97138 RepID=UPI0002CC1DD4|nr:four-carbon acid sugar kinase family protein [Clostridium sp. MD294]USF30991.1 D-threonate kinase [Clostridium sp. MD294]